MEDAASENIVSDNSNSVSGKITKTSDVSKNQKLLQNNSYEFGTPLQTYNRFDGFHNIDTVSEKNKLQF